MILYMIDFYSSLICKYVSFIFFIVFYILLAFLITF